MSQRTVMFHDLFAHNARSAQGRGISPEAWAYRCGSARPTMVRTGPYDMPRRPGSTAFDKSKAINPRESCRAPYGKLWLVNGRQSIPLTVYNKMVTVMG